MQSPLESIRAAARSIKSSSSSFSVPWIPTWIFCGFSVDSLGFWVDSLGFWVDSLAFLDSNSKDEAKSPFGRKAVEVEMGQNGSHRLIDIFK